MTSILIGVGVVKASGVWSISSFIKLPRDVKKESSNRFVTSRGHSSSSVNSNEVIKNRIILEAKRLLVHTSLTTKEIAYDLGYNDLAYFSRLFQTRTG